MGEDFFDNIEKNYYSIIDKYADEGENFVIRNSNDKHASYLIKTFFDKAREEICIFTGRLYDGVFGDNNVKSSAINFLESKPKAKLRIAYQDDVTKEEIFKTSFLKDILSVPERKEKIEIWDARKTSSILKNHFAVMDQKAFRYELDKDERKAIANFGDIENAKKLTLIFNQIVISSEKVIITN